MAHSHQQTLLSRLGFADPDHSDPKHTLACEYLCRPEVAEKIAKAVGYTTIRPELPPDLTLEAASEEPSCQIEWASKVLARVEVPVVSEGYKSKFYIGFIDVSLLVYRSNIRIKHTQTTHRVVEYEETKHCFYKKCELCQSGHRPQVSSDYYGVTHVHKIYNKHTKGTDEHKCSQHPTCCKSHVPTIWPGEKREHIYKQTKQIEDKKIYTHYYREGGYQDCVLVEVKVKPCDPADIIKQLKLYREYVEAKRSVVATCYPVSQSTKDMFKREGIHHIFLGAGFEEYCKARRSEQVVSEEGL